MGSMLKVMQKLGRPATPSRALPFEPEEASDAAELGARSESAARAVEGADRGAVETTIPVVPDAFFEPDDGDQPDAASTRSATQNERSIADAIVRPPRPARATRSPGQAANTVLWDTDTIDPTIVAIHASGSTITEKYRSLRARLLNIHERQPTPVILVTSSLPQEGKSVTCLNLGITMAEGGERNVLIADLDFRRGSVSRMLGIPAGPGLADVIRGDADLDEALRPTPMPNLTIMTAGDTDDRNTAELLNLSVTHQLIGRLRNKFDFALLDMPPTHTVSDVITIAPHCDGALMVVEMGRTPEPMVHAAVSSLQNTGVRILGCVLSRYRDGHRSHYDRYYNHYRRDK